MIRNITSHPFFSLLKEAIHTPRALIMGILNVTPDSFSDGGLYNRPEIALDHAMAMIEQGADILDIGGESTRPGADSLPLQEELDRVLPVIQAIAARHPIPLSIDTYKSEVAEYAINNGASIINDISGLTFDPNMMEVAAKTDAAVCIMHIKGTPRDMQNNPVYGDVVLEVKQWLLERADAAISNGVIPEKIILDPGLGFGKNLNHNLELMRRLDELCDAGYPVLVGPSRKSAIGTVLGGLPPDQRIEGTAAAVALCIARGARIARVHDVLAMKRVAMMSDAILHGFQS
jgi:dihydropteroate synthase